MRLATRYACIHASNPDIPGNHTRGNGTPSRKKCGYCGGAFYTETGLWGAFHWAGYNARYADYAEDNAVRIFTSEVRADEYAAGLYTADSNSDVVIRWIAKDS